MYKKYILEVGALSFVIVAYFIAIGMTIDDFLNAEINLFGVDDEKL